VAPIAVCLKWVPTRAEVDPLTGAVDVDERFTGVSAADRAALEWALRLAEPTGSDVLVVTAGPPSADGVLRDALAAGAARAVRVDIDPEADSSAVAVAVAPVLDEVAVVCCGDYSLDRGSGSVPAFLAAELGAAQASGLVDAAADGDPGGAIRVTRRLDQGRREVLSVGAPAVLSFEGGLELRRASLPRVLTARSAPIEVWSAPPGAIAPGAVTEVSRGPYRPRARVLPPPIGDTRQRVLSLTGALVEHSPPQLVELAPAEAATAIIEQLRTWGYLPEAGAPHPTPGA
jgi:electron transfer flavoprotein beta subunit